jgi:hypothetical protein
VHPTIHDVAVKNVTLPAKEAYPGWSIGITIGNLGYYTETANVSAYLDSMLIRAGNYILTPGEEMDLDGGWELPKNAALYANLTLRVEVSPVPGEITLDNNVFAYSTIMIKMVADVSFDKKVDAEDIALAIKAYGSFPAHPRWNIQADINGDNKVDAIDIALTLKNYGKTFP